MNHNQNNDKPNQGNNGNESQEQTNHGHEKREIDPNTPVAKTGTQDGTQNTTANQNQPQNRTSNTPGFKQNNTTATNNDDQIIDDQYDSTETDGVNEGNHIDSRDTKHDTDSTETDDDKIGATEADDLKSIQKNDKSDGKNKFN